MKLIVFRVNKNLVWVFRVLFLILALSPALDAILMLKAGIADARYHTWTIQDDPFEFYLRVGKFFLIASLFVYLGTFGTRPKLENIADNKVPFESD